MVTTRTPKPVEMRSGEASSSGGMQAVLKRSESTVVTDEGLRRTARGEGQDAALDGGALPVLAA